MLELRALRKSFGDKVVLDGVDLRVRDDALTVVSGTPGNGKSVLARLICGLEEPDSGTVELDGRDITSVAPGARGIGYVPQSFALFPHYSVAANIGYPLKLAGLARGDVSAKVHEVAAMLDVENILDKGVDQISGGQKQRVALARGLVKKSRLYLLDDPLVGLDFKLREQLVEDLRLLRRQLGATFLYFSSEPLEAMALADTVGLLADGRVVESSHMPDAYLRPRHIATALSLGFPRANRIPARVEYEGAQASIASTFFVATLPDWNSDLDAVDLVIRPEDLHLTPQPGAVRVPAQPELVEDLGGEAVLHLRCGTSDLLTATIGSDDPVLRGDITDVWLDPTDLMVFDPASGQRVGREEVRS